VPLDLQTAQHAATVALNAAAAIALGGGMASLWLRRAESPWASLRLRRVRIAAIVGLAVALLTSALLLWLEAAAIAEVPVAEAGASAWTMLSATHYGLAWKIGMAALVFAIVLTAVCGVAKRGRLPSILSLAALAVFFYSRSMVSHAADEGDLSLRLVVEWVHLTLISLWVGEVFIAGALVLPAAKHTPASGRPDRANYVAALSTSATVALAGIFATGLFSAWRNLGGFANVIGNPYGDTLLIKLALVGFAAALGGFNRFIVMPPLLARERDAALASDASARKFGLVLQIEAAMLFGVLILAAMLSSTAPPASA
jgi:putative copper resistance protein D